MRFKSAYLLAPIAMLAAASPSHAQQVRARASVPGQDYEIGTFYYNNGTTQWQNGVVKTFPGVLESSRSAHAENPGAEAFAYADLASGKVGASAFGLADNYAEARASYQDYLTFAIAGANAATITPIRVIASLHSATRSFYGADFAVGFSNGGGTFSFRGELGRYWYTDVSGSRLASFNTWVEDTTQYFDFTYNLVGANPTVIFGMDLRVLGGQGSGTDMAHTAGVQFTLPGNVSFTSNTGVFLSSAVPESSTWAMMIGGLALVGGAMRRRRRIAVHFA